MSDIKHPNEIDVLYNSGQITLLESNALRETWNNLKSEEKFEYKKYMRIEDDTKIINDMTDIQLLRSIAQNMRNSLKVQRSTNGWITFMGVLQLISLIGILIAVSS